MSHPCRRDRTAVRGQFSTSPFYRMGINTCRHRNCNITDTTFWSEVGNIKRKDRKTERMKDLYWVLSSALVLSLCQDQVSAFTTTPSPRTTVPLVSTVVPSQFRRHHEQKNKIVCASSWTPPDLKLTGGGNNGETPFNVRVNEFFKQTVPPGIRANFDVRLEDSAFVRTDFDFIELLTSPPGSPGVPRPLWLVILGSKTAKNQCNGIHPRVCSQSCYFDSFCRCTNWIVMVWIL